MIVGCRERLEEEVVTVRVPIAEGLFTMPADGVPPQLIGTRCAACGEIGFPAAQRCARCDADAPESALLSSEGILWTWTTQEFRPPSPPYAGRESAADFRPFGVGYVELAEGIRIETRLTDISPDVLAIGGAMRMTLIPLGLDDAGNEIVTFAFEPIGVGE